MPYPLRRGSEGAPVRALQVRLTSLGLARLLADGRFGPATEGAVKAARRRLGLPPGAEADAGLMSAIAPEAGLS